MSHTGWLLLSMPAVLALVVSCGSSPEPSVPTTDNVFRVDLSQQHFGMITAVVVDHTGLVVSAQKGARGPGLARAAVFSDPSTSRLVVTWLGGVCRFGPTVTLNGAFDELLVSIQPEAGPGLPPGIGCDAMGLSFAVDLMLAEPVPQQAITVTLVP